MVGRYDGHLRKLSEMVPKIRKSWKWLTTGGAGVLTLGFVVLDHVLAWGILSSLGQLAAKSIDLISANWAGSLVTVLFVLFAVLMSVLWRKFHFFASRVAFHFDDSFKKDLDKRWVYHGAWKLVNDGLSVTGSFNGGITRVGQLWTDYSFEFIAVMVQDPIGWIVRAQDLFNYYMIQLSCSSVRPHLRIGVASLPGDAWLVLDDKQHSVPLTLNEPVKVRTEVRGSEARVYVNDKEVYYSDKLFSMHFIPIEPGGNNELKVGPLQPNGVMVPAFTTGRVGFRMAGQEHGRILRCRVRPL